MHDQSDTGQPVTFTTNPKLDATLTIGWDAWEAAARQAGADAVAAWLAQRLGNTDMKRDLVEPVRSLLEAADDEERALARAELAEIVEDDEMAADTLWTGVLAYGRDVDDAETMAEAISHLAAIAEAQADPLAAAEYHLDFLNWRRQSSHASDPEAVENAFDEVIRLARRDGEQHAAALFEYRQAAYTRLAEAEDDRATEGDWEKDPAPYESWA